MSDKKEATVRMRFKEHKMVNGECVTDQNMEMEVAPSSVARWKARGGVVIGEEVDAQGNPAKGEAGDSDLGGSHTGEENPEGDIEDETALEDDEEEFEEEDNSTGKKKKSRRKKPKH